MRDQWMSIDDQMKTMTRLFEAERGRRASVGQKQAGRGSVLDMSRKEKDERPEGMANLNSNTSPANGPGSLMLCDVL